MKGKKGGFHEKAEEMGCTFVQLRNRVKHFRDTVTRHDRNIETKTPPRIISDRERTIIENFGFLRQAVHIRVNRRKKDTVVLRPVGSPTPERLHRELDSPPPVRHSDLHKKDTLVLRPCVSCYKRKNNV